MDLKRFLLLYMGPFGLNPTQAPITQASLDQWTQQIGTALVDRGTLLSPFARSLFSDGRTSSASFPTHGYSIIQAQDITSAISLLRGHPFLANDPEGDYEIQIMELTNTDVPPDVTDTAPVESIMGIPVSTLDEMMDQAQAKVQSGQNPAAPQPIQQPGVDAGPIPANPNNGELNVPHDAPRPGETINPPNPYDRQQPQV